MDTFVDRQSALTSVGSGWSSLINKLYDELEKYPDIKVIQIKEKFGRLRIYTNNKDHQFTQFIYDIEHESSTTCEACGATGEIRKVGWWKTLCPNHTKFDITYLNKS